MCCDHGDTDCNDDDKRKKKLRNERKHDEVSVTHCGCKCMNYPNC